MDEKIKSFSDLRVYENTYKASLRMYNEILPFLPAAEKFDLSSQLSRSSKAIPRLIAEGYAKKHQKAGFQKYLDDALAECNETIVGLCHCRDIYKINENLCNELISVYDISARQIYKLAEAWDNFKSRRRSGIGDHSLN
ncbi:MAG: four helix bundle protein [Candidatus Wolfebacteria bacterium]|nr:four helix bundle protein [Candidatus Wolfebacteria bacterium]